MRIYFLLTVAIAIEIPNIQALKCRTREHMKQQQDFYNLASNCMKSSMNITQSDNRGSWDYRQHRQQQPQQQPAQHHGNRQHYDNHYDTNGHHGNRYDRNKMNFGYNEDETPSKKSNMCVTQGGYNYRENGYKEETSHSGYLQKRDTIPVQKYVRKNMTNSGLKKSPLEDIGACVIHCIFREMKMLNSDSKVDRQAMISMMTNRIRDSELKEFIQDSIEECFDILDSDNHEEQCDFSKKLILCLEEKAKRGCEDWEIRENATQTSNFNFSKDLDDQNNNENQNINNQQDRYSSKSGLNGRYSGFNLGQRKH